MTTATTTTTAEALDQGQGNGRAAQLVSNAPGAIGSFCPAAAGDGPIVQRLVSSGPTGNERQSGPRPATVTDDDQGGGVLICERNAGGWYVGPGRPGRDRACDHCGRVYQARRSSSRFCSTSCRVAAWYEARGDGLPAAEVEGQ
jgi:hypothetical protein